ncbi:QueT transporter family protein [Pseudogracilibacillus auburnensis]|uniref:Putative membrane protein n=1 Tax=Pseudogracilibacillus auburnensis TaxID=1494959 RepID=A0A2V3VXK9_9BACI|nr:QueT transporter family protein [Pseudogracilibacillus auburnensis]MBO1004099.1 QueT transporter family protein [Pseudogracilibacillus auburnensis]PXW85611.1 putative membrane protein [Pseudogracilibacillus auburnensis]
MNIRTVVVNALVAALYFVVTAVVAPFGFLHVQFRLSELFNHLIVFNKKYFYGIILGVLISNIILSPTKADVFFGVLHTAISLGITLIFAKFVKDKIALMLINTTVFSVNMFIIAYMLKVFVGLPDAFSLLWLTLGISEFVTMALAILIIYLLNKRLKIEKLI